MADKSQPIGVASDHNGLPLKDFVRDYLRQKGFQVDDLGVTDDTPMDYPDIAVPLAEAVAAGKYDRAVLVCGTGAGMAIVANKMPGVRAVCVNDPYTAERARASNDAQVITLGSQVTSPQVAQKLIDIWLESEFQVERSGPKVAKVNQLDQKHRG